MKRGLILLISMMAAALTSCITDTPSVEPGAQKAFTIRLNVEDIDTGVQASTRANIPSEDGETTVNSLYLLFYENTSDGSGAWVKTVSHTDISSQPLSMNASYEIPADGLTAGRDYSILALANVTPNGAANGFLGSESITEFLGRFSGITEKQAIEQTAVEVIGVGADETDNTKKISPDNLVMSARVVKPANSDVVEVKLTRGLARIDVELSTTVSALYELVSASIWGAATRTSVWYDKKTLAPDRMTRFYGLEEESIVEGSTIKGGLYAFENFVANPVQNDQVTTCLILGLKPLSGDPTVKYYRANINPNQESQNLVRNHAYKLTVNSVNDEEGSGADNEYNAWSQSRSELSVSVNAWQLDDNGMVLTDGENTMIMPVKLVRLDPDGDVREFSIFTIGSPTLSITRESYPAGGGIRAELIGSLLRITADRLPAGQQDRRGSVEISFGSLRGTVSFVQSPSDDKFLDLNRYEVPSHAPLGRGGTSDNVPFTVSASGEWTAKIINMSEDADNPGFSFQPSGGPVTTMRSVGNPFGNMFQIYTTGDNPSNVDARYGFVMITLDEDPMNFSRVIILTQDARSEVIITPSMPSQLRFSPTGIPYGQSGNTAAEGFEFEIDPGKTAGVTNTWNVTLQGDDAEYFYVEKVASTSLNRFSVKARGTTDPNLFPYNDDVHLNMLGDLSASLVITIGTTPTVIPIVQEKMGITVSTRGTTIPAMGGETGEMTVNINSSLTWSATILSSTIPAHTGHLVVGSTNAGTTVSGQSAETRLKVGFDKIYYPMTNVSPKTTIRISLDGVPGVYSDVVVSQDALTPRPMNIMDVRNSSFGSLTGGDHYLEYYRSYLSSSVMFGVNGKYVETATPVRITPQSGEPGRISSDYAYLHVGGQPSGYSQARHSSVNDWWTAYGKERLVVYFMDNRNDYLFYGSTSGSRRTTILSMLGIEYDDTDSAPRLNTSLGGDPVYDYLTNYGPAGAVSTGTLGDFNWDTTSTGALASSLPDTAVPIITDGQGSVMMFIDPANNLVYSGESQMFNYRHPSTAVMAAGNNIPSDGDGNRGKLLTNILSYMLNAAQYGSHFTDLFLDGNSDLYDNAFVE